MVLVLRLQMCGRMQVSLAARQLSDFVGVRVWRVVALFSRLDVWGFCIIHAAAAAAAAASAVASSSSGSSVISASSVFEVVVVVSRPWYRRRLQRTTGKRQVSVYCKSNKHSCKTRSLTHDQDAKASELFPAGNDKRNELVNRVAAVQLRSEHSDEQHAWL